MLNETTQSSNGAMRRTLNCCGNGRLMQPWLNAMGHYLDPVPWMTLITVPYPTKARWSGG